MLSEDIIILELNKFHELYNNTNSNIISQFLQKKRKEINDNLLMFQQPYHYNDDRKFAFKKIRETTNMPYKQQNVSKLYILPTDFTEKNKLKKSWIGILNKLTTNNKDNSYNKLKELLVSKNEIEIEMLYDILWDFIKSSGNSIYFDVLIFFDPKHTLNYITSYINEKLWYPSDYFIGNNILSSCNDNYDIYCEYIKWKKNITNLNNSLCVIAPKYEINTDNFNILLQDLYDLIVKFVDKNKTHKHIIDFALEQICNISKHYYNIDIINNIRNLEYNSFDNYTKFIILNILEINHS